jgi:phosphodiesterase/alkaline phosphatase D-like protein
MKPSLSMTAAFVFGLTIAVSLTTVVPPVAARSQQQIQNSPKPDVSNGPVAEYIADTRASVGWSTRGKGHMRLRLGTDPAHLDRLVEATEKDHGRNHHANVDHLKPDTQYFFQVVTTDNEPASDIGTFRTLQTGATAFAHRVIIP